MSKRVLTPEQEDDCLARSEQRRQNSNKRLAAMYGVAYASIVRGVERARRRKEKKV